jgi:hypothetical protein
MSFLMFHPKNLGFMKISEIQNFCNVNSKVPATFQPSKLILYHCSSIDNPKASIILQKTNIKKIRPLPPPSPQANNSRNQSCVPLKIMWLLKSPVDQNSIMINHKPNGNFRSHIILEVTQEELLALLPPKKEKLLSYSVWG